MTTTMRRIKNGVLVALGLYVVTYFVRDGDWFIPVSAVLAAVVFWTVPVMGVWTEERRKGAGNTLKNVAPVVLVAAAWALLLAVALPDRLYLVAGGLGFAAIPAALAVSTWLKERRARKAEDGAETRVRTTAH